MDFGAGNPAQQHNALLEPDAFQQHATAVILVHPNSRSRDLEERLARHAVPAGRSGGRDSSSSSRVLEQDLGAVFARDGLWRRHLLPLACVPAAPSKASTP